MRVMYIMLNSRKIATKTTFNFPFNRSLKITNNGNHSIFNRS